MVGMVLFFILVLLAWAGFAFVAGVILGRIMAWFVSVLKNRGALKRCLNSSVPDSMVDDLEKPVHVARVQSAYALGQSRGVLVGTTACCLTASFAVCIGLFLRMLWPWILSDVLLRQ